MSSHVKSYLRDNGPATASTIADHFQANRISYDAARKRIQRAKRDEKVGVLTKIRLPHKESILYHTDQYNHVEFWEKLIDIFEKAGSSYAWAVRSLEARDGIALRSRFPLYSGRPTALKGQLSAETVLQNLVGEGMLTVHHSKGLGEYVTFGDKVPLCPGARPERLRARLITEEVLLRGIRDWARQIGLVSYDAVRISEEDELPQFG